MRKGEVLQTERCILRELALSDMDALFRLYEPSAITRFVEPLYDREKEEEYQKNYIRMIYGKYGYGMWLVIEKATSEVIGRAGIEPGESYEAGAVELGYIIAYHKQKKGFATEVCRGILDFARDEIGAVAVYARASAENEASNRLLKNLGFKRTGRQIDDELLWKKPFYDN